MPKLIGSAALITVAITASGAHAEEPPVTHWGLQLEAAVSQMTSNTLQKPNDASADRFDAVDYTGKTAAVGRLGLWHEVNWWRPGSTVRLEIVPLQQTGTDTARTEIRFNGERFQPGIPLTILYRFNTYRVTFDLPIFTDVSPDAWEFRAGGTLAIRDAQIRLKQVGARGNFINFGPVPLAYGSAAWRISKTMRLESDVNAFPAPGGGGLLDFSSRVIWTPERGTGLFVGVRYLTGGAVDNSIYNFLHQRQALAGVRVAW
jgi:hypothetical protein